MSEVLYRVLRTVSTVLTIGLVLIAFFLVGIRIFGVQAFSVLSGSMEPTYHVGSLVYVKSVDSGTLKEGDAITFSLSEGTVATHRIIDLVVDKSEGQDIQFQTKGDANNMPDGTLVDSDNVIGKVIFSIPYLGYLAEYVQTDSGMFLFICIAAVTLLLTLLVELLSLPKGGNKSETKN